MIGLLACAVELLPIPWANVRWIHPIQPAGTYVVGIDAGKQWHFRTWPDDGRGVWLKVHGFEPRLDPTGTTLHVNLPGETEALFTVRTGERLIEGDRVGLLNGKPAALRATGPKSNWELHVGGKRLRPPKGWQFLMLHPFDGWIVADRVVKPPRPLVDPDSNERDYFFELSAWRLDGGSRLRFGRFLGVTWYDGGSTGVPMICEIADNGLAMFDEPGGAGVIRYPLLSQSGRGATLPFEALNMRMTQLMGPPIALKEGFVADVWVIDTLSETFYDDHPDVMTLFDLGRDAIAWLDGSTVQLWTPPVGMLNMWRSGDHEVSFGVLRPGGVEIRRLRVPFR